MAETKESKPLTEQEKKRQIEYHLAELKKLRATPRSDWHAGFEALLRIETHRYADLVHIHTEEEIGEVPPRADFVILTEDAEIQWEKDIFQPFRRINILEYKNPHDSLNERVLRKVSAYANLYISAAEHEGDRPSDQVTISVFRAVRNPELFAEMERQGSLLPDTTPGIYHVKGITDLPFRIIITGELQGEVYAAYRALTDKAEEADVARVMKGIGREKDEVVLEHYRVLLRLITAKNPELIESIRRDGTMSVDAMDDVLLEIVKDKVDAQVSAGKRDQERQTTVTHINDIMKNLKLTVEQAMDALSIPMSQRKTYAGLLEERLQ